MAENYKHLYEQTKKILAVYQDELVPGFRKTIEELEAKSKWIPVSERLPDKELAEHREKEAEDGILSAIRQAGIGALGAEAAGLDTAKSPAEV